MIHKVFSVYDSKAEIFLQPFCFVNKGQAIRAFSDTIKDATHQFAKHPEDFTLFELGSYDDSNAKFDLLPTPYSLCLALDFVNGS